MRRKQGDETDGFQQIQSIQVLVLKTERYYSINLKTDGILKIYDQYLNEFIPIPEEKYTNEMDLIERKSASKKIIV